ncbi:MAG: hypothetical protein Q9166_000286 [cf. Caloplaca sp. 2 TL-2023]
MAAPKISIKLSLSQNIYHFSNPSSPQLTINISSDSSRPFTIFTWSTILNARLALLQDRFVITDLTDGIKVPQSTICIKRGSFKRVRGWSDENYFLTIQPGTSTDVSIVFGVSGDHRPQPKGSERNGRVLDTAHGVDGLIPGHRYRLDVAGGSSNGRPKWWRWGTKDDILVDETDVGNRTLSSIQQEKAKLRFARIEGIEFSVEE